MTEVKDKRHVADNTVKKALARLVNGHIIPTLRAIKVFLFYCWERLSCLWADLRSLRSYRTCQPSFRYCAHLWCFPAESGLGGVDTHGPAGTAHVLDGVCPRRWRRCMSSSHSSVHVVHTVTKLTSGTNCFFFGALLCWEQGHFFLYMLLSCGRPTGRWLIRSSGEAKDWDLLSHLHLVFHVELPSHRRKQAVDPVMTGSGSQGERWMTICRPSGRQKSWRTSSIRLKSLNSWIHSAERRTSSLKSHINLKQMKGRASLCSCKPKHNCYRLKWMIFNHV